MQLPQRFAKQLTGLCVTCTKPIRIVTADLCANISSLWPFIDFYYYGEIGEAEACEITSVRILLSIALHVTHE